MKIASRCDQKSKHPIECVVINACESEEIAHDIRERCEGVKFVISWKTEVDDIAAKISSASSLLLVSKNVQSAKCYVVRTTVKQFILLIMAYCWPVVNFVYQRWRP